MFCEHYDTISSVSSRSPFLLDAIVSIGCRSEEGFSSSIYRLLQSRLRDHLASLLINTESPTPEDIQAITLMAAYSDNGFLQIALALRFSFQLGLPRAVDELIGRCANLSAYDASNEQRLYRLCRIWHCVCNFELLYVTPKLMPLQALTTILAYLLTAVNCLA
jgi:hypothetical protein